MSHGTPCEQGASQVWSAPLLGQKVPGCVPDVMFAAKCGEPKPTVYAQQAWVHTHAGQPWHTAAQHRICPQSVRIRQGMVLFPYLSFMHPSGRTGLLKPSRAYALGDIVASLS